MNLPGALAALALLAAAGLASEGAQAQDTKAKRSLETEVIRSITDVTRYDAANGQRPLLLQVAQKAADSPRGKIIDVQRRRTNQRLPVVVRGAVPDDAEDTSATTGSLPAAPGWRVTSGRNFWFYNREEGLLIGCRLVGTAKVGDNKRVKCSRPRRAPGFH